MSRRRKGSKEGRVEEDSQEKGSKKSNNLEKCCIAVSDNKKKNIGSNPGLHNCVRKTKSGFSEDYSCDYLVCFTFKSQLSVHILKSALVGGQRCVFVCEALWVAGVI